MIPPFPILRMLVLLLCTVLASCGSFGLNEEQLLQKARNYLESREYQAAAIEARNTLQKNPQNAEARYILGVTMLEYGDFEIAEREFRRADELNWGAGEARTGRGRALLELEQYEQLLDGVDPSNRFSDTVNAELLALRAAAEAAQGNTTAARRLLDDARILNADALQGYLTEIQMLLEADDQQGAARVLDTALQRHPQDPQLQLLLASLYLANGDATRGKQLLQAIIIRDPPDFISIYGVNARLRLVEQLILEEHLDEAKRIMEPLYGRTRNAPYTNYLGALLAFDMEDYELAEQRLLKVLKFAPDHEPTRLLFATVNYAQQDYEQAAYFLSKYVARNRDHLAARKLLGRSYMKLDQPEEARRTLEIASDTPAADAELLVLVGLSALRSGDTDAGFAGLQRAMSLDADKVSLRRELASMFMSSGETGLAFAELQSLINSGVDEQAALIILGNLRSGEFDQAINSVLDLLSTNPSNPVLISLAANVFAASGDYREARRYFEQALSQQADFYPASLGLARLEELEGNIDRAVVIYRNLVDKGVDSSVPVLALARIEGQQGNTRRVVDLLQSASTEFPDEAGPKMLLAEHYLREQEYSRAMVLLDETLANDPEQPVALYLLGRTLIATGRHKQAVKVLEQLQEIDPDSAVSRLLLAEAHLQQGATQSAREVMHDVMRDHPDNAVALVLMARLETLSGNLAEATRYSQRIQALYPDMYIGYMTRGDILVLQEEHAAAGEQYRLAWEKMRRSELAIRLSEIAQHEGDASGAVQPLTEWLADHPGDARVRRFLGATWLALGEPDRAMAEYQKVLNAHPDDVVALNNLAWIYYEANDPRSRGMAEQAYRLAPDNPGVIDTYGWILLQQGEIARARQLLDVAAEQLPQEPEVSWHLAVALHRSGELKAARRVLEDLLSEGQPFPGREEAERLLKELGN